MFTASVRKGPRDDYDPEHNNEALIFNDETFPAESGEGLRIKGSEFQARGDLELTASRGVFHADQTERSETVELEVCAAVGLP